MNILKVSDLVTHPKNDYYFDDIVGEKWERLLDSIEKNGVRTPIIVTDNMVIVSGNQRVRACRELGILTINGEVVHYANDDDIIRDLIEINIRQRGVIDDSEIKQGRRFEFLQQYYGVREGRPQKLPNNSEVKTQKQIADESGVSVDTMNNYIKLSKMIPEMQELLRNGVVTKTTALSIVKKLSPEEQKQLAEQISGKDKVSGSEIQKYIEENQKLRSALSESEARRIAESGQVKEVVREVEVVPDDYEEIKKKVKSLESENRLLESDRRDALDKWFKADERVKDLEKTLNSPKEVKQRNLEGRCFELTSAITTFLGKNGGVTFTREEISKLSKYERQTLERATDRLRNWLDELLNEVEAITT